MTSIWKGRTAARIAALRGASSLVIQGLLGDFAARRTQEGWRVAGVVEVSGSDGGGACGSLAVRELASGRVISISQNLGPGSTACNLDPGGLVDACAAVERAIGHGVDLVVLSKFGKTEAARGGLGDAFRAAIAAGIPVVTAVSPLMAELWLAFAGDLSDVVAADPRALDAWWEMQSASPLPLAAE